jgi:hypothetical protein
MFEHKVFKNARVLKIHSFKKCTCLLISYENWSKFQIIIDIYIYIYNIMVHSILFKLQL